MVLQRASSVPMYSRRGDQLDMRAPNPTGGWPSAAEVWGRCGWSVWAARAGRGLVEARARDHPRSGSARRASRRSRRVDRRDVAREAPGRRLEVYPKRREILAVLRVKLGALRLLGSGQRSSTRQALATMDRRLTGSAPGKPPADDITIFMCGDVMTGRGIDQILPHPSDPIL